MNGRAPLVEIRVSIDYPARPRVADGLELSVGAGEIVALVGASGSGKSSLALALLGLLDLKGGRVRGSIRFGGRELVGAPEREMRGTRGREIAFVPQSPASYLNPAMRLREQVAEAWRAHRKGPRGEMERAVGEAVAQVGLPAEGGFLARYPGEVSLGQAQRVLIAMAILHRPRLLVADEPTSSLDVIAQAGILRLLGELNRGLGMAILYISHDLASVAGFADRVAVLAGGRIVESGETARVFEAPADPYTRELIAAIPEVPGRARQGKGWAA